MWKPETLEGQVVLLSQTLDLAVEEENPISSRPGSRAPNHRPTGPLWPNTTSKGPNRPLPNVATKNQHAATIYPSTTALLVHPAIPRRRLNRGNGASMPPPPNLKDFGFHPGPRGEGMRDVPRRRLQEGERRPRRRRRRDRHRRSKVVDFPGGKLSFVGEMNFVPESQRERIKCYRVLHDDGRTIYSSRFKEVRKELALKMYSNMVTLQIMDTIFYEAQRQGRISFYLTSNGEEAINVASAAALSADDIVLPQYREPGVLLWRGFTLQEFANQLFGNKMDYGKGRQMPIHYGSNRLNYFTVSSPIATQLPQAVGAAYSLKMEKKDACAITYISDGGTSEGDFHAALNFAAVTEAPVVFFCRNNGWAISTPTTEQFRSDGVVTRGQAYGIRSIRVDGNDTLAVYSAVHAAREIAITEGRPILIEAMTYRVGHHSTSDDSTKYRPADEIEHWRTSRDPISRYRKWVQGNGWWCDAEETELRNNVRQELLQAIQVAERIPKHGLTELFTDVYDQVPSNLREQQRSLLDSIQKHPSDYPTDVPV